MQPARKATAKRVWHQWWCVPLLLGFVFMRPTLLLHAASNTALVADAAQADDLSAVRKLIKEHADVNAPANDGSTALLWAAYHSNAEMTKALLAAGATVDDSEPLRRHPSSAGEPQRRHRGHAGAARCGSGADALAR